MAVESKKTESKKNNESNGLALPSAEVKSPDILLNDPRIPREPTDKVYFVSDGVTDTYHLGEYDLSGVEQAEDPPYPED